MSVLNQVIIGVLLMVTLVVVALMVRVYQRTGATEQEQDNISTAESDEDVV